MPSEFRDRMAQGERADRLLAVMVDHLVAAALVKRRGAVRTDSTHVLAAVRTLNRAELVTFYSPEPFPIPRLGEPTDVSRLLLFLTSSDASFITGSEYVIDGGLLLGPALQAETA